MSTTLDQISTANLARLCTLAFWLGEGGRRFHGPPPARDELRRALAGVPTTLIGRFDEFLRLEATIPVPDDHLKRVMNLAKLTTVARRAPFHGRIPPEEALEQEMTPQESALLIRWCTWTEEIPRHAAWWYRPPDELPV